MIYLIIVYTIHYKVVFVSTQPPLKKSLKSKSGVYIKFEIHIFAPSPPFLNHIFGPKEIYYNGWVRAAGENFKA